MERTEGQKMRLIDVGKEMVRRDVKAWREGSKGQKVDGMNNRLLKAMVPRRY